MKIIIRLYVYTSEKAFDGMIETIISDYKFIPQARTIHVDSRYLLWTLEKFENDKRLINEMTIID